MSRLSTDGSVSGLLAWLICWNIFHYWSGKQRLFFWKIGMQRQIWPQHCRCIKHFGRGINVVLLHRRCCFSLETKLLSKYLCRKDRAVLMAVLNLQLFTFISGTDSLHLSKDCEKESSETTSAFNEDERLFGDFRRHIVISQGLEETSVINALYKTAFWACFKSLKICLWRVPLKDRRLERQILF